MPDLTKKNINQLSKKIIEKATEENVRRWAEQAVYQSYLNYFFDKDNDKKMLEEEFDEIWQIIFEEK